MISAISGVAAVDWNTVVTYTLAALFPACIIGFATWLWRRGMKARRDEQARQKQARDAALAAQIAQTVRDNFATVTESFATLETNVTQRINDSDAATETQIGELKTGQAAAASAIADLQLKIAAETGGNSNGLRQELNSVSRTCAEIKGAFDQHIRENTEPKGN